MALADVCVDEKWRSNVQNESEHRFTSYFILLNSQEQKFDDRFLLQIESLTTQGQYPRPPKKAKINFTHTKMLRNSLKIL